MDSRHHISTTHLWVKPHLQNMVLNTVLWKLLRQSSQDPLGWKQPLGDHLAQYPYSSMIT